MYPISEEMKLALGVNAAQSIHHLRGTVEVIAVGERGEKVVAETIYFGDWSADKQSVDIIGTPSYNKQCTASPEVFGIGQLYTGTASVTLALREYRTDVLRGAELTMEFGIEGISEWIPLGRWIINDPRRDSVDQVTVNAVDCISKLDVSFPVYFDHGYKLQGSLDAIADLAGVEFEQTADEIMELMGDKYIPGTPLLGTCREAVAAIAQMCGGFAFSNRQGRIEFRRFGLESVWQIFADPRQSARLSEYTFGVRGLAYIDKYGRRTDARWQSWQCNTEATIVISNNPYVWDTMDRETAEAHYLERLSAVQEALEEIVMVWTPGQIEYYGNPALDLGDVVQLNGGIGGGTKFLITADSWQFRGAQTLISAGAAQGSTGAVSSGGVTSTQQAVSKVNLTLSIATVPMTGYTGELTDVLRPIAEGTFSVKSETAAFASVTVELTGTAASDVRIHYLYDGVKQTVQAVNTVRAGETRTVTLPLSVTASTGTHTISVEASGEAEISRIEGYIWGQSITPELPEMTVSRDYEYTVTDGAATITRYIGTGRKPSVPAYIGGAPVRAIEAGAFMGTNVEYVYIPEGVEEIR